MCRTREIYHALRDPIDIARFTAGRIYSPEFVIPDRHSGTEYGTGIVWPAMYLAIVAEYNEISRRTNDFD